MVVPLAVDESLVAVAGEADQAAADRSRLGLPDRYLAFVGRYDARRDLRTLLAAMATLGAAHM